MSSGSLPDPGIRVTEEFADDLRPGRWRRMLVAHARDDDQPRSRNQLGQLFAVGEWEQRVL